MPEIGPVELIIVAFVVLLLFGPGKAADLGSSLGKGIREFRRETARGDDAPALPAANAASASPAFCTQCGSRDSTGQKFCTNCGASIAPAV